MALPYSARLRRWKIAVRETSGRAAQAASRISFEPRDERVPRGGVRSWAASGRHEAGAQLPSHLFPNRRIGPDVRHVERVEGEVGGAHPLVVTGDAVAIDQGGGRSSAGVAHLGGLLLRGQEAAGGNYRYHDSHRRSVHPGVCAHNPPRLQPKQPRQVSAGHVARFRPQRHPRCEIYHTLVVQCVILFFFYFFYFPFYSVSMIPYTPVQFRFVDTLEHRDHGAVACPRAGGRRGRCDAG